MTSMMSNLNAHHDSECNPWYTAAKITVSSRLCIHVQRFDRTTNVLDRIQEQRNRSEPTGTLIYNTSWIYGIVQCPVPSRNFSCVTVPIFSWFWFELFRRCGTVEEQIEFKWHSEFGLLLLMRRESSWWIRLGFDFIRFIGWSFIGLLMWSKTNYQLLPFAPETMVGAPNVT